MSKLSKENIKKIRNYLFSFEDDAKVAFALFEREEMRKRFGEIDREEDFEILDSEIESAIVSSEREEMRKAFIKLDEIDSRNQSRKMFVRYAIAAVFIGVLFTGTYLLYFNNEVNTSDSIVSNYSSIKPNQSVLNIDLPKAIENEVFHKAIISGKTRSAFALLKDSLTIEVNGISKQIDTLQKILEGFKEEKSQKNESVNEQIVDKIDSLQALLNTYTYDFSKKKAILNLSKMTEVGNIISIDPNRLSKFYINIKEKYYLIETNTNPVKLLPVRNRALLDSLRSIEFLND